VETAEETISSRMEAERGADNRVDVWSILVVFASLVLTAVHFVSGWTFDF
jgi:hypothetical protein